MIGGPPCTDFSIGGLNRGHGGEAGALTSVYINMLIRLKPSFFVIENVPNLLNNAGHKAEFEKLLRKLQRAGYFTKVSILNSINYGVPQDRRRMFAVGFNQEILKQWYPESASLKQLFEENFSWPEMSHPNAKEIHDWPKRNKFGLTPRKPRGLTIELCVWQAVCKKPDPEKLPNGLDYFNAYSHKFTERDEGDVSSKSFKRLHRYRYSPTSWYGNNEVHLHPFKLRRLSVREALRLQTVPDSYKMPESIPLSSKFKVIGNGVPCKLANLLGMSIQQFIHASVRNTQSKSANSRAVA